MLFRRSPSSPHPPFEALPVQRICVGRGDRLMAVHVRGTLGGARPALVCIPGYQRNMTDFSAMATHLSTVTGHDQPIVLLDLAGRGRSDSMPRKTGYSTLYDAEDVLAVSDALGLDKPVFFGQGHGGHVVMAMSVRRPNTLGGAILLDSGPVADPRGFVRMRNNLRHVESLKSAQLAREAMRRILATDYPSADESALDQLGERLFRFDRKSRASALYDQKLLKRLDVFEFDDALEPQWPYFDSMVSVPLLLMRTQLTDQLRRETFDEMARRRNDAATHHVEGEGSPALLSGHDEIGVIADFLARVAHRSH